MTHEHDQAEVERVARGRPWYRLPLCWVGMCTCTSASDDTGCWGECVTCGRRFGFVSREDLRAYIEAEQIAHLQQQEGQG